MKRFMAPLLAALVLATSVPIATAQTASNAARARWEPVLLQMRTTTAANLVALPAWSVDAPGYADSSVFRKIVSGTAYDTTKAVHISTLGLPPNIGPAQLALSDTTMPWIALEVSQDSTSYSWTGSNALDSVRVATEYSYNGTTWHGCYGTNTYRFDTVYLTTGTTDFVQAPTLIGVEGVAGEDRASVWYRCDPDNANTGSVIANKTLCMAGDVYIRFIVGQGGDNGTGQFKVKLYRWVVD